MPSLRETYDVMHAVLRGQRTAADGATALGVDPTRLAIYQNFVHGHVTYILTKIYPRVSACLSPETWNALAEEFFATHPPTDWELNEAAAPFAAYLATQLGQREELALFHISLAQFEWAQWSAYCDLARIPAPEDTPVSVVNPTLRILELPCPVIHHIVAMKGGDAPAAPWPDGSDGPERVLIFRHPSRETSAYWRASPALILALATVDQGLTSEDAATTFGCSQADVVGALARAHEIGLCIMPA